jgi:hypothetical protein
MDLTIGAAAEAGSEAEGSEADALAPLAEAGPGAADIFLRLVKKAFTSLSFTWSKQLSQD